ncbi:hypothetical protein BGX20_009166 [Mortierella sp. AD010]|nr:hypothetical protein BGX20_009166 [Mortierella sp. AD010]
MTSHNFKRTSSSKDHPDDVSGNNQSNQLTICPELTELHDSDDQKLSTSLSAASLITAIGPSEDHPKRKRVNLTCFDKREIIGISDLLSSSCYETIIAPIYKIRRNTPYGFINDRHKLSMVPQTNTHTRRTRGLTTGLSIERDEIETGIHGPLDGKAMVDQAISKLIERRNFQFRENWLEEFKEQFREYLESIRPDNVQPNWKRPEGSLFENCALRYILRYFDPSVLFSCEIADVCQAIIRDPLHPSGQRESTVLSLLVCNKDCSMSRVSVVHLKHGVTSIGTRNRKIFFSDRNDLEQCTFFSYLRNLDYYIGDQMKKKVLLLFDETQWNSLRSGDSAPLRHLNFINIMIVPKRFRSILPLDNLAKRINDSSSFIYPNHDTCHQHEAHLDTILKTFRDSIIHVVQTRFDRFLDHVGKRI